jgi:phosphatidylglycerophosphate synthase
MMLAREFWVGALREFNARNNITQNTKVTFLAKMKTAVQMLAFGIYLLGVFLNNIFVIFIADFVLLLAFLLSIQSAISYTSKTFSITAK